MQWNSKIIASIQLLERSLKLTRMGSLSVTGGALIIRNGGHTHFLHAEGLMKTSSRRSNCQKPVSSALDLDENSKLLPGTKAFLRKAYKTREENLTGTQ